MNNAVDFIQTLIDKIEDNLDQEISIKELADSFRVSQWHFQRLFKALVGDSLSAYIKGRRLNSGANLLLTSQLGINDIAYRLGFLSHEAFTLSFEHKFGLSPQEFRLQHPNVSYKDKPNVNQALLEHLPYGMTKQPHIELRQATVIVGYQTSVPSPFIKNENHCLSIYPSWKQIIKHRDQIQHHVQGTFYGLTHSESGDFTEQEIDYIAGVPVTRLGSYPEAAVVHHLPEQLVATFDVYVAKLDSTERTIDYIYGYWLANSDYERGLGDDYEVFEHVKDFSNPDELKSKYVIPIRKRKG
ncbi:hypothetical protein A9Q77_03905 [Marinomonas sp. 42_23_T18]|nr:hypothetical protein A9Q77_03905 [Marinomonas sp. 42_23_T18]